MRKPAPTDLPVLDAIRERWSPVAFHADKPVEREKLRACFEAARWAASSQNEQPWAFVAGDKHADLDTWSRVFETLADANRAWANTAPVLILSVMKRAFDRNNNPNPTAQHDTGMAVAHFVLQAVAEGLHTHQMGGYDANKARQVFGIPDTHAPVAVIALGYAAPSDVLDDPKLQTRNNNGERVRKPLSDFVYGGTGAWGEPSPLIESSQHL